MNVLSQNTSKNPNRRGLSMVEVIVAAGMLTVVMSAVTTMAFRIRGVHRQIARHQHAMTELENQLDKLTRSDAPSDINSLASLDLDPLVADSLGRPILRGQFIDDVHGRRISLRLTWPESRSGPPIELIGWMTPTHVASSASVEPAAAKTTAPEPQS